MSDPVIEDRPYQDEGVEFLAAHRHALLAFDTRMGKSRVALRAATRVGAKRVLIISPAIGRLSWEREIELFGVAASPIIVRPGVGTEAIAGAGINSVSLTLVVAYDTLSMVGNPWVAGLSNCATWDVLVLDECQYLKDAGSNRTKAVYGKIAGNAKRIWCLSATPTPNHAGELYTHYKALWPGAIVTEPATGGPARPLTRHEFEDRFCRVDNTPWGRRIKGSKNASVLRAALAPYVLRKRKQDVFKDLPAVAHNLVPLDVEVSTVGFSSATGLDALLAEPKSAVAKSIQRKLGEDKAPGAVAWLREQLRNHIITGKVVVFAWHTSVLKTIFEGLADYEPVLLDGGTSETARIDAVRQFQTNPNCRVFVGQIKAAGTAICLDAADDVVMVEPSWVPMDNYQAASRVENLQQRKPVTVSWLYVPGSLDTRIMAALRTKTRELSAIWD